MVLCHAMYVKSAKQQYRSFAPGFGNRVHMVWLYRAGIRAKPRTLLRLLHLVFLRIAQDLPSVVAFVFVLVQFLLETPQVYASPGVIHRLRAAFFRSLIAVCLVGGQVPESSALRFPSLSRCLLRGVL